MTRNTMQDYGVFMFTINALGVALDLTISQESYLKILDVLTEVCAGELVLRASSSELAAQGRNPVDVQAHEESIAESVRRDRDIATSILLGMQGRLTE